MGHMVFFYSNKKYSKFILRFEYKWGEKIANNFNEWQYDAGVYYHVVNENIWPTGIEYQIRYDHTKNRNHTGDLIRPEGVKYDWYFDEITDTYRHPNNGGKALIQRKAGCIWQHLLPNIMETMENGINAKLLSWAINMLSTTEWSCSEHGFQFNTR